MLINTEQTKYTYNFTTRREKILRKGLASLDGELPPALLKTKKNLDPHITSNNMKRDFLFF